MHDIAKIGIPDKILLKPGGLNVNEWETMKRHSQLGAEIIGEHPSELLKLSREISLQRPSCDPFSGLACGGSSAVLAL